MSGVELSVGQMFQQMTDQIQTRSANLMAEMNTLLSKDEINPEDMLMIQFEMGQYNALLEATSTITKSLVDEAKQLAQRTS